MKLWMGLLALAYTLPASADQTLANVQVRDGSSTSSAQLVVDSSSKGEAYGSDTLNRINKPVIRLSGLHRDVMIAGHDQNTTNILCGLLDPSKAVGGVGQIGALDQESILKYSHSQIAVLSLEKGQVIATLQPALSGAANYVHENIYCADHVINDGGGE